MKIIIFSPKGIRPSKRNLFQLEKLGEEGFDILVINASTFFNRKNLPEQKNIHKNTIYFKTELDISNFSIKEEKVLFLVSDAHLNISSNILAKIKRNQDVLLSYSNKVFVPIQQTNNPLKKFSQWLFIYLDKIFPLYFLSYYYKIRHNQIIPDYFLGTTQYLTPTKIRLTVNPKNRIFGHSDDFNEILQLEDFREGASRFGVFVDQAIPFHNLFFNDTSGNYIEEYYENLTYWLNTVKNKYKLDNIVIALHPRSTLFIDDIREYVQDFELIGGKTIKLIKESFVVISHFSAALGSAIYYDKPTILFHDNTILSNTAWNEAISYFNEELKMPLIDMSSRDDANLNFDLKINSVAYNKYKTNYIKDNTIDENAYYHAIKKVQKLEF